MRHLRSKTAIKNIPSQHVSPSLSPVGPAYYLIEASAAILAENTAYLLAEKLCVSVSMPKAFIRNNLVSLDCQLLRNLKNTGLILELRVGPTGTWKGFHKSMCCRTFQSVWGVENRSTGGKIIRFKWLACMSTLLCMHAHVWILIKMNL